MINIEIFTKPKIKNKNEDYADHNKSSFIVVDGATDKSGKTWNEKTGGQLVSELVAKSCLNSNLIGSKLVNQLNKEVRKLYEEIGKEDFDDPINRFTCGFVLGRINGDKIIITYLGDLGFRINGEIVYQEIKKVDIENAEKRSEYIKRTGNVDLSRDYIMQDIINQFEYQNNQNHELGYGVIDGTETPEKFVRVFEFNKSKIQLLEFFSDGYFEIPGGTTKDDWENIHYIVERLDPDKYLKYKSTKSKDDRTLMIIKFE